MTTAIDPDFAKYPPFTSRAIILVYGVISYLVGVAGLACIILGLAQLIPMGFFGFSADTDPVLFNLLLVAAWGFIHSGMARSGFKRWLTKYLPEPAERATYTLVAGVTSAALFGFLQPVAGTVWSISHPTLVTAVWILFAFGWIYLLVASFAINHFDLFGLRQVYLNFRNQPRPPIQFVKRAMYSFSRHPIQTGVLIGLWVTPLMSATQLVLSVGMTIYIFIGLWFEEKDLVRDIGQRYVDYRREAGMFLPRIIKRR